jgi:uncharacterized alpha-E superfamily protein
MTSNTATNLYWLGRHLERTEATLLHAMKAYDKIIDVDKDAGKKLYKTFGIDLEYTNALNFLSVAIFDDHASNLFNVMKNARENAIISRPHIDAEAFGEIIELHSLFERTSKESSNIDYKFLDKAHSLIREIWGSLSKREHKKSSDYFFRLGKLVEELDFKLRFNEDATIIAKVIHDIDNILETLADTQSDKSSQTQIQTQDKDAIMNSIHEKIAKIIIE